MELFRYMKEDKFPPENSEGNVEYKCFLKKITDDKMNRLITQMQWRLSQGYYDSNEKIAYYVIGIYDNGTFAQIDNNLSEETINILQSVSEKCNAKIDRINVFKYHNRLVHILKISSKDEDDYFPLF